MSDQSKQAESTDPRVEAALRDYLERIDRGEVVNREEFIARHAEIADALRSFFAAEEPLRKMAATKIAEQSAGVSTRSMAAHGQETVPPRLPPDGAAGTTAAVFRGKFGRYQIIRALGKGAMGAVYLAEDSQLERKVAIKTPHFEDDPTGELIARFYREARAAATLRHANICPVHDVGQIDGKHFISMAYIEGRPLSDVIRGGKAQNERQIAIAVHKLARALQQAHDHGIVHRDLKPANIMVDKQGEPIIMDFGLARKARKEGEASLTQSGAILGSPAYMSPEQIEGDPESVGPLSDQYSLGVVLYEMLTGQLPFRGSVINVLAQIITKGPTPPSELRPGIDPRIEAVCLKMMAKKASDRFPSMKSVSEQLAVIVKNPTASPTAAEKSPTASQAPAATPVGDEARASQIRKSVKQKTLTESDVTSLEELVRKCARRRDYDQMIQIIERVPEDRRSEALQTLLEKAREKVDEISFLICEIDEADRLNDRQTALKKAEELLKIKPGHHRAKEIQEKYSGYGDGGAARISPLSQFTKPWSEGGWIPWSALAFGLIVFAGMYGVMVIYLGKTAIVVDIKDPGVEVALKGTTLTLTGPDKQSVKVEPGEQELKITSAGFETTTRSFSLKKGDKKTVTVSIVNKEIVARFENEVLPSTPANEKAANPTGTGKQEMAQSPLGNVKPASEGPAGIPDPDRRAAEWVLSIGGTIKINENGSERDLKAASELPARAFELTLVYLGGNPNVTTEGLTHFRGCKNVSWLYLNSTNVNDAGLGCFKDCRDLTGLDLANDTKVSDAGLAYFKDCKGVRRLNLCGTQVSAAGLASFENSKNLTELYLSGTQVGDAGLAYFKDCKNLTALATGAQVSNAGLAYFKNCEDLRNLDLFGGTKVSDAGLACFKNCKGVSRLNLCGTQVSDAGLVNFKDSRNLTELLLSGTQVGDAGLKRLAGFPKLVSVFVDKTSVTEAGVKKLAAALPRCKIEWDGGVIQPKQDAATMTGPTADGILNSATDPDRRAAEWVLSIGGRPGVEIDGEERDVDRLPPGPFKLRKVHLYGNQKLSDSGLACFRGCSNLKELHLWTATKYGDAGLGNFKDCKDLRELYLEGDQVTDVGLENFKDCDLTAFGLAGTKVTDQGLAYFKNCKNLQALNLRFSARVSDVGLAQFQDCTKLKYVDLYETKVTDAGLAHLSRCVNLEELYVGWRCPDVTDASLRYIGSLRRLKGLALGGTSVTNAGLALLEGSTKLETLEIYGTRIRGSGLAHLRNRLRLKYLDLRGLGLIDGDLAHLRNLTALERIRLSDSRVSGPGLVNLNGMHQLHDLDLDNSRMTNSGLEQLKNLPQLQKLHLRGTQVTDAGLHHLEGLTNLDELDLSDTKVTAAGVEKLQKLIPACKILANPKTP